MSAEPCNKINHDDEFILRDVAQEYKSLQNGKKQSLITIVHKIFELTTLTVVCFLALLASIGLAFDLVAETTAVQIEPHWKFEKSR